MLDLSFYNGKKVLVTGHTGFKGTWLCNILLLAGADVTGYSLEPPTDPSMFEIRGVGVPAGAAADPRQKNEFRYRRYQRLRLSEKSLR